MKRGIRRVLRSLGRWEETNIGQYKVQRCGDRDYFLVWDMKQGGGKSILAGDQRLVSKELAHLCKNL